MKRFLLGLLLVGVFSLPAITPKGGKERLRELAVRPRISLRLALEWNSASSVAEMLDEAELPERIERTREKLKVNGDDIQLQLQMGALLSATNEANAAKVCYEKAEQLGRRNVAAHPRDGLALIYLANAVWGGNRLDEAESLFRKATVLSAEEWRCWAGLGQFLDLRANRLLFPTNQPGNPAAALQQITQKGYDEVIKPGVVKQVDELYAEAAKCYDRVLALAPREPNALLQHMGHEVLFSLGTTYLGVLRGREQPPANVVFKMYSPGALADIKQLVKLVPDTPKLIGAAAYFEYVVAKSQSAHFDFSPEALPDSTRQLLHEAMNQLEKLGQSGDKKLAARAYENLALIRMLATGNPEGSAADARRAIALDPLRDQCWDFAIVTEDQEEMIATCEKRLTYKDSARNRLILAVAFIRVNKWDKAAAQAEIILKREADDVGARMLLAAYALRQSADPLQLKVAYVQLDQLNKLIGKMPAGDERNDRQWEHALNGAIFNALIDQPKAAKDLLNAALKNRPDDASAKEILSLVE